MPASDAGGDADAGVAASLAAGPTEAGLEFPEEMYLSVMPIAESPRIPDVEGGHDCLYEWISEYQECGSL